MITFATPARLSAAATTALSAALWAPHAWAQAEPAAPADAVPVANAEIAASNEAATDGVVTFDRAFFDPFNPVTALDMVNRVPGFSIDNGDDRRGFGGASGNVLLNGERPTSKTGVSNTLGRIAALNVARIDLLRGGAANAEAPGQSVVVNVVLVDGALAEPVTTWRADARLYQGGRLANFARVARAFTWRGVDVNVSAHFDSFDGRPQRDERLVDPSGALLFSRDEFTQDDWHEIGVTLDLRWAASERDVFTLTSEFETSSWNYHEYSQVFDPAGEIRRFDTGFGEEPNNYDGQIGVDWERRLSDTLSFKLIGLQTFDLLFNEQLYESFVPVDFEQATRIDLERETFESIARGVVTYAPNDRHVLDFGLEAALNSLENRQDIEADDGSGAGFVSVPLSLANTRVEEVRGEAFISHIWRMSDRVTLESGLTFEASRLTQTGDAEAERTLTFWKPRLAATFALNDQNQLRLVLERDVAQLDFDEFASSVDIGDGSVSFGNPDLEPERTWSARAAYERRFADRGVFSAEVFVDAVEAVQDVIPIGVPGARFDAPGNLGDGTRIGLELEADLPLDVLGVPGGLLQLDYRRQRSRVDDPLTGEERDFAREPNWAFDLDFRQDVPSWDFAWGFDWHLFGDERSYRANEFWTFAFDEGDLDAFIETTRFGDLTLTAGVDNIFDLERTRERTFFDGDRASQIALRREIQQRTTGPLCYIRLSGAF